MAGQVVQAIIVPENGNLELLKEIFGNDFDKILLDMAEKEGDGTSVIYYQAQKSAIPKLGKPVAVGETGVKICTGELSEAVGPTETVATFALPVIEVVEKVASETQAYGFSDFATRIIGELKKSERRLLEEVKTLVAEKKQREEEIAKEIENETETVSDAKSANTGGDSMSTEKEFVTKEDLTVALQPLAEKTEAMAEGLASLKELGEAIKSIQEKLTAEGDKKTADTDADSNADQTKAASVDAADVLKGFKDKIETLETDLAAAKSAFDEQTQKIDALQHAGGTHTEVEDPAKKTGTDGKSQVVMNTVFAQRGWV